jgi:hypothetical protein
MKWKLPKWSIRKIFATILFGSVTIGNAIQKFSPNGITVWFKEPEITMSIYAISIILFLFPWSKKSPGVATALSILAVLAAAFLTWLFSHLWT